MADTDRGEGGAGWSDPALLDEKRAGDEIADLAARVAQANEDYHTRDAPDRKSVV